MPGGVYPGEVNPDMSLPPSRQVFGTNAPLHQSCSGLGGTLVRAKRSSTSGEDYSATNERPHLDGFGFSES